MKNKKLIKIPAIPYLGSAGFSGFKLMDSLSLILVAPDLRAARRAAAGSLGKKIEMKTAPEKEGCIGCTTYLRQTE